MLKQEIIEQTIIEIENHGIDVIGDNSFPIDAITNNRKKINKFTIRKSQHLLNSHMNLFIL